MRQIYVMREGKLVNKHTGEPVPRRDGPLTLPRFYVMSDLRDYVSPVTGKVVSGRRARKYDLESNNCREVDPSEWHGEYYDKKLYDRDKKWPNKSKQQ